MSDALQCGALCFREGKELKAMRHNLGDLVADSVTGYQGIITARCEYRFAPNCYAVEALVDKKPTTYWFNEDRLEYAPN